MGHINIPTTWRAVSNITDKQENEVIDLRLSMTVDICFPIASVSNIWISAVGPISGELDWRWKITKHRIKEIVLGTTTAHSQSSLTIEDRLIHIKDIVKVGCIRFLDNQA